MVGAAAGYFLLALAWAVLFIQIENRTPGSFGLDTAGDPGGQLIYFSLVTVTTLGFGDIVPVSAPARILTAIAAASGTLYIAILIGSQVLNLTLISFGGEHYIQQWLRSFDNEITAFLIVMVVLFILGFVLDFLEIIYIVVPIVGPVIYGGTLDPKWVTIMIAVNLQTSFLTPPFGFALFYLRGVAPPGITTGDIYRGVIPFVIIQVVGLLLLYYFPQIVTFLPDIIPT
ncbi:MAG TPA: hypothetical protein DDY14_06145 [Chromatiaceae bacterium]|nr:hypothetical protein [Chromatiaceae bacterium]